jgi:hypothetical protein
VTERERLEQELREVERAIEDGYWRFSRSAGRGLHLASAETYRRRTELRAALAALKDG